MAAAHQWLVLSDPPRDLLFAASGFVPLRLSRPVTDVRVTMSRLTTLQLQAASAERHDVAIRVVVDGVRDAALRAFDCLQNLREQTDVVEPGEPTELLFAPGTELELVVTRGGVAGAARRIVIGNVSPQVVIVP